MSVYTYFAHKNAIAINIFLKPSTGANNRLQNIAVGASNNKINVAVGANNWDFFLTIGASYGIMDILTVDWRYSYGTYSYPKTNKME